MFATSSLAQTQPGDTEPPVANRVEPFSGAVGRKFAVTTHAEPTELTAGDTLTLTVRVTAEGAWQRPPNRPDLRRHEKHARFPRSFHIENGESRHDPAGPFWEFVYRLRPLSESVAEVPRLPFVYYRPGQGYQTLSAPAVPLTVRARAEVTAVEVKGGAEELPDVPERMLQLVRGPGVLNRETPTVFFQPLLILLVALGVPLLCGAWYAAWRWRNPEAARLARQRRSRAAQQALRELGRLPPGDGEQQARQVSHVLADYLRNRFDLPGAEPTPGEVAAHLVQVGVPVPPARAAAELFAACDAVRFAGEDSDGSQELADRAHQLILDLENVPCLSPAL